MPRNYQLTGKACINCWEPFQQGDMRGRYGPGSLAPHLSVGPFCERCYALIKIHEAPAAQPDGEK